MVKLTAERGVGKIRKTSNAQDRRISKLEKRMDSLEKLVKKLKTKSKK